MCASGSPYSVACCAQQEWSCRRTIALGSHQDDWHAEVLQAIEVRGQLGEQRATAVHKREPHELTGLVVEDADRVPDTAEFQLSDQEDHVRQPHCRQIGPHEALAQVQNQVRITRPQQADQTLQVVFVYQAQLFDPNRVGQQRHSRRVRAQ